MLVGGELDANVELRFAEVEEKGHKLDADVLPALHGPLKQVLFEELDQIR